MKKLITIGRQFGAGGGELGRRVAHELGIAYYDKDLILRTAQACAGLSPDEVREVDETVPWSFGFTQSLFDFYNRPLGDRVWDAQVTAIRQIADKQSCVIVGRNADYILREFDHCLRIFVHAALDWRVQRMHEKMPQLSIEQLRANLRSVDKARKTYCERYTGHRYGDATCYDLTLCTSKLGMDASLCLILQAASGL